MSAENSSEKKFIECTGPALDTVNKHSKPEDVTFFGNCWSPFVQRVWLALEYLEIPYKYHEIELGGYKPKELLDVSPQGLVPGLVLHSYTPPRGLNESTVILQYLEDFAANTTQRSLLPPSTEPYARALVRLQSDHVLRTFVPAFYRYMQAQGPDDETKARKEFHEALDGLIAVMERSEKEIASDGNVSSRSGRGAAAALGMWVEGGELGWTDVLVGPWLYRALIVLKHYNGFVFPAGTKLSAWLDRLFAHPIFKATCSTDELYITNYKPYASGTSYFGNFL